MLSPRGMDQAQQRQVNELRAQGFGPKGYVKYIFLEIFAIAYLISIYFLLTERHMLMPLSFHSVY